MSTFSSLNENGTTTKSVNNETVNTTTVQQQNQTTKRSSATTTKGSNVLRSHIKKKRSVESKKEEFLNSSMPIHLPNQQQVVNKAGAEPFVRTIAKSSGGRKITATNPGSGNNNGGPAPMLTINH